MTTYNEKKNQTKLGENVHCTLKEGGGSLGGREVREVEVE